jgi:DNA topoisomerase-3
VEYVVQGDAGWRTTYPAQREHKLAQLDQMMRYAQSHTCRMLHLVEHFGDQEDSGESCGLCDICSPTACRALEFCGPNEQEIEAMQAILATLQRRDARGTGQLYREACAETGLERRAFERLLGGLARAGLIRVSEETFEKGGQLIPFQRASLTADGQRADRSVLSRIPLSEAHPAVKKPRASTKTAKQSQAQPAPAPAQPPESLVSALKSWRLAEARRHKIPAFRILTDRTLLALAAAQPSDEAELLAVSGIGPTLTRKYGEQILALMAEYPP